MTLESEQQFFQDYYNPDPPQTSYRNYTNRGYGSYNGTSSYRPDYSGRPDYSVYVPDTTKVSSDCDVQREDIKQRLALEAQAEMKGWRGISDSAFNKMDTDHSGGLPILAG